MTNEAIEVGDLVAVVRGHECVLKDIGGIPFVVDAIHHDIAFHCSRCDYRQAGGYFVTGPASNDIPLAMLKKFPPLAESESVEHTESVPA